MNKSSHLIRFHDWSFLKCQLLWAYRGKPEMRVMNRPPTGFPDVTQAYLLYRGSLEIFTRKESVKVSSGQWIFASADRMGHEFSRDAEIISICMHCHWLNDWPLFPNDPPRIVRVDQFSSLERIALKLVKLSSLLTGSTGASAIHLAGREMDLEMYLRFLRTTDLFVQHYAKAMLALGQTWTDPVHMDPRVMQAKEILNHQPLSWPLKESWLAQQVHLSPRQLNRLFSAYEGMTLRDYSQKRRVTYAIRSLVSSHLLIKQISAQLGFKHVSHFTKWFYGYIGRSPRQYRDQFRDSHTRTQDNPAQP